MHAYASRSIRWRKAKRSYANNECVEVAHLMGMIAVRDSTLAERGSQEVLSAPIEQWESLVNAIKGGLREH